MRQFQSFLKNQIENIMASQEQKMILKLFYNSYDHHPICFIYKMDHIIGVYLWVICYLYFGNHPYMLNRNLTSLFRVTRQTIIYQHSNNLNKELIYQKYYQKNQQIPGYCTEEGTNQFKSRNTKLHPDHWKKPLYISDNLSLSSLGLGTQNGAPTPQDDIRQLETMIHSVSSGNINVIDTDVNFRYGKSEKVINAGLNYLIKQEGFKREQLFVATKAGYIMNDVDSNLDDQKFKQIILEEGYAQPEDIIKDIYCLSQSFIKFSVQKSRLSLGLETIDLMYLNNPIQALLAIIGKEKLYEKLQKAFSVLQELRQLNIIRYYGIASFVAFRSPPNENQVHGSLAEIAEIARKIGGQNHGLRFCLVPFNLGMPEAILNWQQNADKTKQTRIFNVAEEAQININLCCPLFQGRLIKVPFQTNHLNYIQNTSAKHLQLIRSIKHPNLISTIFGSLSKQHSQQNCEVGEHRCLTKQEWQSILPIPNELK